MFRTIVDHLSLILVMLVSYQYLHEKLEARLRSVPRFSVAAGMLYGIIGVLAMLDSYQLAPGILFDGRSIVMGIAGMFGGPLAAFIAALICAAVRLMLGGEGSFVGIAVIAEAAALGAAYHALVKARRFELTPLSIAILAFAIHSIQLAIFLFLPNRLGFENLSRLAPMSLIVFPAAFLFIAWIFQFVQNAQDEHNKLNASEQRYRAIFENNTAMMLLIDPEDGRIVDANPAAASFYGYSRQTLRQMKITQINTLNEEEARNMLQRMLATEHGYFTLHHQNAAGEMRNVEIYSASIKFNDRSLLHEIIHDVTDREHALRERLLLYEAIDESFNEVYIFDDATLHFTYASQGALRNLGYTMEQMRALTPMDLKQDMPASEFMEYIRQLRSGEKSNVVFQTTHTRADRTRYPVEVRLSLYKGGEAPVFLAIIADMTEYRRAMDAISSQMNELKRWHTITLNREERIIGLKREVNALLKEAGLPERYKGEHIEGAQNA